MIWKSGSIPSPRAVKRSKRGKEKVNDAETHELGPSFADLPFPITTDILLRLPIKSVLFCKRVCKTWNTLISDPHFAKLHFERTPIGFLIRTCEPTLISRNIYLLEDELDSECNNNLKLEPTLKLPLRGVKVVLKKQDGTDVVWNKTVESPAQIGTDGLLVGKPEDHKFDVVNSCNGLPCLSNPRNNVPFLVCNPVTDEFIRLPKVTKRTYKTQYSGIGFDYKTNEYKVVRIEYGSMNVEINVVGTPTWRNVKVDPSILGYLKPRYPTFVKGALYWIFFNGDRSTILCFNFETEQLQLIGLPSVPNFQYGFLHLGITMGALGDSLFVCNASVRSSVDVWIMKKEGTEVSWTKDFTVRRTPYSDITICWPLKHFEKGRSILEYSSKRGFIYYYKNNRNKKVLVCGTEEKQLEVIPYIPSLISLKDMIKGDNIDMLNVQSRCKMFKLPEE